MFLLIFTMDITFRLFTQNILLIKTIYVHNRYSYALEVLTKLGPKSAFIILFQTTLRQQIIQLEYLDKQTLKGWFSIFTRPRGTCSG